MAYCDDPAREGCGYDRGMHWIGYPAALVPFADLGGTDVTDNFDPKIRTGMGGERRVRLHRIRPPRSWKIDVSSARADDVSNLRSLITSTSGPYQLITADAQVTNVLTPEQATMQDVTLPLGGLAPAGWWPIVGERSPGALTRDNPSAMFGYEALVSLDSIPAPPVWTGRSVTVSAMLATARSAGARVFLQWRDAAGTLLSDGRVSGNYVTGMDGLRRSTASGKPPAGAVAIRLSIQYAEVIAQPQVTWTDEPTPEWSMGNGADQVVVAGFDQSAVWSRPERAGWRRGDYTLDLEEAQP